MNKILLASILSVALMTGCGNRPSSAGASGDGHTSEAEHGDHDGHDHEAEGHDHEAEEAAWVPLRDVSRQLAYPNERRIVRIALDLLYRDGRD